MDLMGIYFNSGADRGFNRSEDAIKMGTTGNNLLWNQFDSGAYSYNTLPFVGDSMRFEVMVKTGDVGNYTLAPYISFPENYLIYITNSSNGRRSLYTSNGYHLNNGFDGILYLDFIKSDNIGTDVEEPMAQESWSVYTSSGSVHITGLKGVSDIKLYNSVG